MDDRKKLFCKISQESKEKIDEMCSGYDISIGELLENLVTDAYLKYVTESTSKIAKLAKQFEVK